MDVLTEARFTNVRTLTIEDEFLGQEPKILAILYPNVRELRLLGRETTYDWEDVERIRQDNISNPGLDGIDGPHAWTSLDILHSAIEKVYAMALSCRVELWEGASCTVVSQIRAFHVVLRDIRPVYLCMSIAVDRFEPSQFTDILISDTVTHLSVTFVLSKCCGKSAFSLEDFLDAVQSYISKLPLKVLAINYDFDVTDDAPAAVYFGASCLAKTRFRFTNGDVLRHEGHIQRVLCSLDTASHATCFAEECPTLEQVIIRFRMRQQTDSYWKITRDAEHMEVLQQSQHQAVLALPDTAFSRHIGLRF
ncbi:hypothetical protein EIP91_000480 [Steccherinum ochraceum]|uniref:Uncharacterized protein n=1 Tax=Steccherinum ochraceum TaxID=92696 RepID=A0A4R0RFN4_9APHY|nr:hypothetical protein EIP91_000480 [Steccherinum ochraceum]